MDINAFQQSVTEIFDAIAKKPGWQRHTKETLYIHLVEEVGELARQIINQHHRQKKYDENNLKEEMADIIMLLSVLASEYKVDLSTECEQKIRRMKEKHNL